MELAHDPLDLQQLLQELTRCLKTALKFEEEQQDTLQQCTTHRDCPVKFSVLR